MLFSILVVIVAVLMVVKYRKSDKYSVDDIESIKELKREEFFKELFAYKNKENVSHILKKRKDFAEAYCDEIYTKAVTDRRVDIIPQLLKSLRLKDAVNKKQLIKDLHRLLILKKKGSNTESLNSLLLNIDVNKLDSKYYNFYPKRDSFKEIQSYLEMGGDINESSDGKTPLMHLASEKIYSIEGQLKSVAIARFLLDKGADPNLYSSEGVSAAQLAFYSDNIELGMFLRENMDFNLDDHILDLEKRGFPNEVFKYIDEYSGKLDVRFPPYCELTFLKLCSIDELRLGEAYIYSWEYNNNYEVKDPNLKKSGYYEIEVIELVRYEENHGANGILIWIPALKQFGTCDTEHGVMHIFKDVDFNTIMKNKFKYLNAQWNYQTKDCIGIYEYCNPWEHWDFIES